MYNNVRPTILSLNPDKYKKFSNLFIVLSSKHRSTVIMECMVVYNSIPSYIRNCKSYRGGGDWAFLLWVILAMATRKTNCLSEDYVREHGFLLNIEVGSGAVIHTCIISVCTIYGYMLLHVNTSVLLSVPTGLWKQQSRQGRRALLYHLSCDVIMLLVCT